MCSTGSSKIIKTILVMYISGVLLNEKHSKTCQPARSLVVHLSLRHHKRYQIADFDPLRQAFSPISNRLLPIPTPSTPKNKDLPPSEKKRDLPQSPPPQKSNNSSPRYLLDHSKMSLVPERN